jgi:ERCC4-type nuclease
MITVDSREYIKHPEIDELLETDHTIARLDEADYAWLDCFTNPIGVERCEVSNYIAKLRSGELEDQLRRCATSYAKVYLLIENILDPDDDGFLRRFKRTRKGYLYIPDNPNPRAKRIPKQRFSYVMSSLISLDDMDVCVLQTPSFDASMRLIDVLYSNLTTAEGARTLFRRVKPPHIPTKLTNNPAVPKLMALVPRIPEQVAIRLIHQYDNIWNVLHTDDRELLAVEGMGKTLVQRLKEGIGKPNE